MRRIKVNGSNFLNSTYFHSRGVGPIFLYNVNPMCVIAGMELGIAGMELGIGLVGWGGEGGYYYSYYRKIKYVS